MSEIPEGMNEILAAAVVSVMNTIDGAFDELWRKPSGASVMEAFLADRVVFQIDRHGLVVAERGEADGPPRDDGPSPYL